MRENKQPKRLFSAYGKLDQKTRNWQALPPVNRSTNQLPRGEELVYRMNETTLEIGQGMSGLRGMLWFGVAFGWFFLTFWIPGSIYMFVSGYESFSDALNDWGWLTFLFVISLALILAWIFALSIWTSDLLGYIDAPVRFDRVRRKVYIWASPAVRKEGPLELDWDQITPVAQSVSAPPYQVNAFKSVLLVDMDAHGDVRFDKKIPRIAQIGAALLNGEDTLAAYEYVRSFMERGPQSLPSVKTHLVLRPRGIRPFVDVFGILSMMRPYPSLPEHQRSFGWLVFGVAIIALFSIIAVPLQWTQGIAQKWTTRLPQWPQHYEELAASGGPLQPPAGSQPNDLPLLPHEKLIAAIWHLCALAGYGWFVWDGMTR